MVWVRLFKPTTGRIAIFIILFAAIALLDQYFLFFPQSPITYNLFGSASVHFVVLLLLIPYIVSCIIPAIYIREFRHAKLREFAAPEERKKMSGDETIGAMESYEDVQERYARSLRPKKPEPKKPEKETKARNRKKPGARQKPRTRRRK
jgi:hypothetical protein